MLSFDDHHADGEVWCVRVGDTWMNAHTIHCDVQITTVYKGPHAEQPRAYLVGVGCVTTDGHGTITIAKA